MIQVHDSHAVRLFEAVLLIRRDASGVDGDSDDLVLGRKLSLSQLFDQENCAEFGASVSKFQKRVNTTTIRDEAGLLTAYLRRRRWKPLPST